MDQFAHILLKWFGIGRSRTNSMSGTDTASESTLDTATSSSEEDWANVPDITTSECSQDSEEIRVVPLLCRGRRSPTSTRSSHTGTESTATEQHDTDSNFRTESTDSQSKLQFSVDDSSPSTEDSDDPDDAELP